MKKMVMMGFGALALWGLWPAWGWGQGPAQLLREQMRSVSLFSSRERQRAIVLEQMERFQFHEDPELTTVYLELLKSSQREVVLLAAQVLARRQAGDRFDYFHQQRQEEETRLIHDQALPFLWQLLSDGERLQRQGWQASERLALARVLASSLVTEEDFGAVMELFKRPPLRLAEGELSHAHRFLAPLVAATHPRGQVFLNLHYPALFSEIIHENHPLMLMLLIEVSPPCYHPQWWQHFHQASPPLQLAIVDFLRRYGIELYREELAGELPQAVEYPPLARALIEYLGALLPPRGESLQEILEFLILDPEGDEGLRLWLARRLYATLKGEHPWVSEQQLQRWGQLLLSAGGQQRRVARALRGERP